MFQNGEYSNIYTYKLCNILRVIFFSFFKELAPRYKELFREYLFKRQCCDTVFRDSFLRLEIKHMAGHVWSQSRSKIIITCM